MKSIMKRYHSRIAAYAGAGLLSLAQAPDCLGDPAEKAEEGFFRRHPASMEVFSGYVTSPFLGIGPHAPDFRYIPAGVRVMAKLDKDSRVELGGEILGGIVTESFGSKLCAASVLARYNLGDDDSKLKPYLQAGAGVLYTDAGRDHNQSAIGQTFEFLLQAGGGVSYALEQGNRVSELFGGKASLFAEGSLGHISNGGMAEDNDGINMGEFLVGIRIKF